MKKTLLIVLLLIVGCTKEPINVETTLVERDGIYYTKDTNKPYTGPVFTLYGNGVKKSEIFLKDGEPDGFYSFWHEDGQIGQQGTYTDGKKDGLIIQWYTNGQKWSEVTVRGDDKPEGLGTTWYENGQKKQEQIYKDGELTSEKNWDEDGNEI